MVRPPRSNPHPEKPPARLSRALWLAALLCAAPTASSAEPVEATESKAFKPRPFVGRPLMDMRVGVDTAAQAEHPYICAEVHVLKWISLEGCGTGAGFLHDGAGVDLAHFRTRLTAFTYEFGRFDMGVHPGVGFAELQVGPDAAGFKFGKATSDDQNEGAGFDASLSGKGRVWVHERTYVVFDLNVGLAVIPAAPTILDGAHPVLGYGALTVGMGF